MYGSQGCKNEVAYCSFIGLGGKRGDAVAWELWDEEGELVLEEWDHLGVVLVYRERSDFCWTYMSPPNRTVSEEDHDIW